jgi:hypothetical protein
MTIWIGTILAHSRDRYRMPPKYWSLSVIALGLATLSLTPLVPADAKSKVAPETNAKPVLWRDPADINSRDLYFGSGGEQNQPHGPYTFVEEDMNGTNPKYVVTDRDGVKWTIKLGLEARPETAASRLIWAVGYFTNDDYYLADLQVANMPKHLKRGADLVAADGAMHAARLKRHNPDEKNIGDWKWRDAPFDGTREFNGLKVMMALVNNWDLKDVNNKILSEKGSTEQIYEVSDIGATFGTTGISFPFSHSKGDPNAFKGSKFIAQTTPDSVSFMTPSRPSLVYLAKPQSFVKRSHLDGLLDNIPRDDARWIGQLLSKLSAKQIQSAFRAAGYTPDQIDEFSNAIQARIDELSRL